MGRLFWFFRDWYRGVIPKEWRFDCVECEDTGWASYSDRIGVKTYHVLDHCRACRRRALSGQTEKQGENNAD